MTIGTEISIGFYPKSEMPDVDERKYNNGVPYISTDEVLANIPLISRAHYLEVNISGHWYYFEADLTTLTPKGTGTTAAFTDLTDCPSTYAGEALSVPTVNLAENGLEFTETKEAEFIDLADVPSLYTGSGGSLVSVKVDETGLEFIPLSGSVPYTGATGAVNLGAYDLTVNSLSIGLGSGNLTHNTIVGVSALSSSINADYNCAFGYYALKNLTSPGSDGGTNNAFGYMALRNVISEGANNAFGSFTLANVLGKENTGFGDSNLTNLVNANGNIALGIYAGNGYGNADGTGGNLTTSTNSIFIGYDCRALANSSVNEVIVGYRTVGHGSNTATWGNNSITNHYFPGSGAFTGSITAPNLPIAGSFSQTVTAVTTFVVTIGQTMANTTYKVCVTPTDMLAAAVFYVTSKSTTQFTVTYLTAITGAVTFDWIIVP